MDTLRQSKSHIVMEFAPVFGEVNGACGKGQHERSIKQQKAYPNCMEFVTGKACCSAIFLVQQIKPGDKRGGVLPA